MYVYGFARAFGEVGRPVYNDPPAPLSTDSFLMNSQQSDPISSSDDMRQLVGSRMRLKWWRKFQIYGFLKSRQFSARSKDATDNLRGTDNAEARP